MSSAKHTPHLSGPVSGPLSGHVAQHPSGDVRLHVGRDEPFVAAKKAHPAIVLNNLRSFIESRGIDATWNHEIEGLVRCHIFDPFGNRIELVQS